MGSVFLIVAGLYGALAVALGAAAAHGLESRLSGEAISWVETAARYMLAHALALLGCSALLGRAKNGLVVTAGIAFALGVLLFCGSLLGLAFLEARGAGRIAPFGGLSLVLGWLLLSIAGITYLKTRRN
jgi:uncharacterized membrane protein YgdD (TMEM256/DUF423 family)